MPIFSQEHFPESERNNFQDIQHSLFEFENHKFDGYHVPLSKYLKVIKYLEWAELEIISLTSGVKSDQEIKEMTQ